MSARALLAAVTLLAGAADAQDAPIEAPCLAVHPQPTDYVRAFQAEGWKFRESGPGRDAALPALAFARLLAVRLPSRPDTPADLADLLAEAADPGQARQYVNSLVFTRGDAVAALDFDQQMDGRTMSCWFAAPDLPEIDAFAFHTPDFGDRAIAAEFAVPEAPVPDGAASITVNAWRLVSGVEATAPIPGAEALSVSIERTEPRFVVPQVHGLLRAFGAAERSEAYRTPEAQE